MPSLWLTKTLRKFFYNNILKYNSINTLYEIEQDILSIKIYTEPTFTDKYNHVTTKCFLIYPSKHIDVNSVSNIRNSGKDSKHTKNRVRFGQHEVENNVHWSDCSSMV